jgi:hypothetical protein
MRKRSLVSKVGLLALSALFIWLSPSTAHAQGWDNSNGEWRYLDSAGNAVSDAWRKSGEAWYYLGDDGNMVKDSVITIGDSSYYLNADGAMAVNRWVQTKDGDDDEGWFYFGPDGKAYKGKEGRVYAREIDGKKYLFSEEGVMQTGFFDADGNAVEDDNPFKTAVYYFGDDGAMFTDRWLQYSQVGENPGYSELGQRNYNEYDEMWLYFGNNGRKYVASNTDLSRQREIGGKAYLFDENGVMIPQLSIRSSNVKATSSNAKIKYGSLDTDGEQKDDYWTFTVPNEKMSQKDYDTGERSWFRTKKNGDVIKDKIATVLGRRYAFDEIGRMQTGFVVMLEDGTFGIKFDVDEWTREDFLTDAVNSPIAAIDRGSLYLFGIDELNDGSMVTGEVTVSLRDRDVVFGFRDNGKAIGEKCTLVKNDGKFYFNGLRLDADADVRYGILKDTRTGHGEYVVVDANGKVVKGTKILKDGEGNWIIVDNSKFVARVSDGDRPRKKNGKFYHYDSTADKKDRWGAEITYASDGANNLDSDFVLFDR